MGSSSPTSSPTDGPTASPTYSPSDSPTSSQMHGLPHYQDQEMSAASPVPTEEPTEEAAVGTPSPTEEAANACKGNDWDLHLVDSWGDGWNVNKLSVKDCKGNELASGITMAYGHNKVVDVCLRATDGYVIEASGGR